MNTRRILSFFSPWWLLEHCCRGSRLLWRAGLRWQHQGRSDPAWSDGDDRIRPGLLHLRYRVPHNIPGELWRGRSHHHMLRRPQPQDRRSLRQNREGESDRDVMVLWWTKESASALCHKIAYHWCEPHMFALSLNGQSRNLRYKRGHANQVSKSHSCSLAASFMAASL